MDFFSILALLGGLGMFLYGMDVMGDSLKKLAGGKLETILSRLTANRIKGFLLGFGVTAIIQSSSATTVMLVGFVNAGIMTLGQTISTIMGANVGTTVTSWLLSLTGISGDAWWLQIFKPTSFTPVLMGIGVIMSMACKTDKNRDIASILMGFAVLMFGMDAMSDSMSGLKDNPAFGQMLIMFSNPVLGILAGTLLTAIIQSSSASVGILQALSMTGAIPYSTAIPIILGQNIGTTITPILSALTGNTDSKRVAFACLLIKILGVLAVYPIFCLLDWALDFAFMDTNVNVMTIAIVHTLFNILSTVVWLPFCNMIEKAVVKMIRAKKKEETTEFDTLDDRFLAIPAFAAEKSRELVCDMLEIAKKTVTDAAGLLEQYDGKVAEDIQKKETLIDMYEDKLSTYLVKVASENPSTKDSKTVSELLHCIGEIERISDLAVNVTKAMTEADTKKITFSQDAQKEIKLISVAVTDILNIVTEAFIKEDLDLAQKVEPLEQVIDRLRNKIKANHIVRLQEGRCSIELGFILADLLNTFERIADHCSNIAVCLLEISHGSFDTHEYLHQAKAADEFAAQYQEYKSKYAL